MASHSRRPSSKISKHLVLSNQWKLMAHLSRNFFIRKIQTTLVPDKLWPAWHHSHVVLLPLKHFCFKAIYRWLKPLPKGNWKEDCFDEFEKKFCFRYALLKQRPNNYLLLTWISGFHKSSGNHKFFRYKSSLCVESRVYLFQLQPNRFSSWSVKD